jgi:hypothetical protein
MMGSTLLLLETETKTIRKQDFAFIGHAADPAYRLASGLELRRKGLA